MSLVAHIPWSARLWRKPQIAGQQISTQLHRIPPSFKFVFYFALLVLPTAFFISHFPLSLLPDYRVGEVAVADVLVPADLQSDWAMNHVVGLAPDILSFPEEASRFDGFASARGLKSDAEKCLLDRVRATMRSRHYSPRTEKAYVFWIRRFIVFNGRRHPDEMAEPEITRFLEALATRLHVSASTQNQAFSAILFLYRTVLRRELTGLEGTPRAKLPERVPVVLSQNEVAAVLDGMTGAPALAACLIYACGLRLTEVLQLRIKDIDFDRNEIVVVR